MVLLAAFAVFLSLSILSVAAFLAWLSLRLYVLQLFLSYRQDNLCLLLELGSLSSNLFSCFVRQEGKQWSAGVGTARRCYWQGTWGPPSAIQRFRMWRRVCTLWKHPQRPAWLDVSRRLLLQIYEQLKFDHILLNVQLSLPSYAQTGYLAAIAYPLNFTLFRSMGVFQANLIPDFSKRGAAIENRIRCSFRGYQLWKLSYGFLSSPVVRSFLWNRIAIRWYAFTRHRNVQGSESSNSKKGTTHGNTPL